MAGYNWFEGMSNNAVSAYNNGEAPMSKWTKKKLLQLFNERFTELQADFIEDKDFYKKYYPYFYKNLDKVLDVIKKQNKETLKHWLLYKSSWHHTSKFYNCTDFYSFDDDIGMDYLEDYFKEMEAKMKTKKITSRDLAWACYNYNQPMDDSWVRYRLNEVGSERACKDFIKGYCESEGIEVTARMLTMAASWLEFYLK